MLFVVILPFGVKYLWIYAIHSLLLCWISMLWMCSISSYWLC